MLERGARGRLRPDRRQRASSASTHSAIAEVAGDPDGGLAHQRIVGRRAAPRSRAPISGWPIELSAPIAACRTARRRAPSSGSSASNARGSPMRASAAAAATASRASASSSSARERRRRRARSPIRPSATTAASRVSRRPRRELLDQQVDHAGVLTGRSPRSRSARTSGCAEQPRQRALDGRRRAASRARSRAAAAVGPVRRARPRRAAAAAPAGRQPRLELGRSM